MLGVGVVSAVGIRTRHPPNDNDWRPGCYYQVSQRYWAFETPRLAGDLFNPLVRLSRMAKALVPRVLDTTTNFIEHPELVAQRIANYASIVGKENAMAGSDCGLGTSTWCRKVETSIVWAKLTSMVEGARPAS